MAEFWILSNFFRQNSFENAEIHTLCKSMAAKYWEREKNELRANIAREENTILSIDVGNLKQLHTAAMEVIEAQSASEALLNKYHDEELKATYIIDQQEKICGYDELRTELETRELINMYEELYNRKIEMANKMEERQIVKTYRRKEEEFLRSKNDCVKLEKNLKAITTEIVKVEATIRETIFQLVKGSKELEIAGGSPLPAPQIGFLEKRTLDTSIESKTIDRNIIDKRPGLSSRLSIKFKPAKIPSAKISIRIQKLNPIKGFDRLLQEAEVLRKSIQLSPDISAPKVVTSIISKESKEEKPRKKVTFDLDTPIEPPMDTNQPSGECENILEVPPPDLTKPDPGPGEKIEILENILIKPPGEPLPLKIRKDHTPPGMTKPDIRPSKRKIEIDHIFASPTKKQLDNSEVKIIDESYGKQSSFMDMFLELSKESSADASSSASPSKEIAVPCASDKKPDSNDVTIIEENKKVSFQGFDEFFASLTNKDSETNENDDFPKGESNFDFFDGNINTGDGSGDCPEDSFSFQF